MNRFIFQKLKILITHLLKKKKINNLSIEMGKKMKIIIAFLYWVLVIGSIIFLCNELRPWEIAYAGVIKVILLCIMILAAIFLYIIFTGGNFKKKQTARLFPQNKEPDNPEKTRDSVDITNDYIHLIQELEEKNARHEQFIYTISHDLKTPLITIKGFLDVLKEDVFQGNQDEIKKDLTFISQAVDKMQNLLNDLLQFARLNKSSETFKDIPFQEIVQEAITFVSNPIQEKKIQITTEENLPIVKGDRTRLVLFIRNLLDNAVKFAGGQQHPVLIFGCNRTAANDIFFVKDNGIALDPNYHQKIFQLFNQSDASGTGIGLTLVKRIIEVHKGTIYVEADEKNQGTTLCFTLRPDNSLD